MQPTLKAATIPNAHLPWENLTILGKGCRVGKLPIRSPANPAAVICAPPVSLMQR
jgi:hypothetical protein